MAKNPKIKLIVTGNKKIDKRLRTLKATLARKIVRQALRKAMKPILQSAKDMAPRDSGDLALNIKLKAGKRSRGAFILRIRTLGQHGYLASFHEFGTFKQPPRPFMRPAFDMHKDSSRALMLTEVWAGIRKSLI